jgi:hypothetical protein
MDREELTNLARQGPIRIRMKDGCSYDVPNIEQILISDISASVLYRHADGKLRHVHLPLVAMSGVEPLTSA